jgi:hypothetical protein
MDDTSQLGADRLKHLEFIQASVARLANGSLLVRGWSLTVMAAFLAALATRFEPWLAAAALVPLTAFWLLDGYFLSRERGFRRLYEDARQPASTVPKLLMDVRSFVPERGWLSAVVSPTLLLFYGALALLLIALLIISSIVS